MIGVTDMIGGLGTDPAGLASSGPLVVAVGIAALAGLVSFASPCVLPLVPGYLSYLTGLAGADLSDALDRPTAAARGRIALGIGGFLAGFTAVFTLVGVLVVRLGRELLAHQRAIETAGGLLIIALGLAFLGVGPQRQWRLQRLPAAGLASAPLLGAVFALSWTPCVGPTLGAVLTLALVDGSTSRAVVLTIAYCLGLGLPFLAFGLGFRTLLGIRATLRRHARLVTAIGGAMLILVGLALATGVWGELINWLRAAAGPGSVWL